MANFPSGLDIRRVPTLTGKMCRPLPLSVPGSYGEFAAGADFVFRLAKLLEPVQASPPLCTGIIGFRSLRLASIDDRGYFGAFDLRSISAIVQTSARVLLVSIKSMMDKAHRLGIWE